MAADCLRDGRYVMGTVLEVTLCTTDAAQGQPLSDVLFTSALRLDSLLTTFSPDSPVSRLNAYAGTGAQAVPPEVLDVLTLSLRYWQLTGGTFDITVGPLMTLWQQAATVHRLPSPVALQQARACIGSEHIKLLPNGTVALRRHGMGLDLGGIGKGYALDQLVNLLRRGAACCAPTLNALLDFGQSSIWALGRPTDAEGWRLLLRQPDGAPAGVVTLRDQALSVSGSLGQSFAVNGRQYGHVIDPRTGAPLQRNLSASVIAPNAAQAEALSKALLILGEQQGIALLQRLPGVEGLLIEAHGQRWMTTGWIQATAFVPL
ncbi:MAG: FAD:protein FMN transferase [Candidatus Binatia bacterium]